ncbi:MAG: DUF4380 domain-containing protein [Anaerolineae bacterium]|nr:DUF4380 domain-containing protein [Anaerolineae bacterium]
MGVRLEKVQYAGWPNCYRLANQTIELIVTGDVGPRIIRFGFIGEENLLKEYAQFVGKTGGDEWRIYGGHRLWHAPEAKPRSYAPDNGPVQVEDHVGFVRVIQPVEASTGIQKELDITLSPNTPHVQVTHRLRNTTLWPIKLAVWALSVTAPGGKIIVPLPPAGSHSGNLLPTRRLALWAYTDMADPRWTWGSEYIMLRQDSNIPHSQKVGMYVPQGWVAYVRNDTLLVKRFDVVPGAEYPDFGSNVETYTDADMLEVETLGPLVELAPVTTAEHTEHWYLFHDVPTPMNDADVAKYILPKVDQTV